MSLRLYAVVGADHPLPDRTGVREASLRAVRSGGLAAVVSDDPADDPAEDTVTDQDAVEHLDVITALVAAGPVVPLRLGTVAPDEQAVRDEVVEPSRDMFEQHLAATADVVEVLATVEFEEDAALREVAARHGLGGAGDSVTDRIAFGEQVAAQLAAATQEWGDKVVGPVAAHADGVVSLPAREPTTARYALLVRRDRLSDVDAEMSRVTPPPMVPFHMEYVGPLPPVDFPPPQQADDSGSSRWGW